MRGWVKCAGTGSSFSLTVGAAERLGRTSQRGERRTEGGGKWTDQSTDLRGGVKCGWNSSVQNPSPKAPTVSPLAVILQAPQPTCSQVRDDASNFSEHLVLMDMPSLQTSCWAGRSSPTVGQSTWQQTPS